MSQGISRAWLAYAGVGLAATAAGVAVAAALTDESSRRAILVAGGIAYLLQIVAFAMLLLVREKQHLFLAGWLGGMLLRFGVVGACLFWATRTAILPPGPLVISLVGFVFVLLLLEPVFLRWDLRKT